MTDTLVPAPVFLGYQDPGDTIPYTLDLSTHIPSTDTVTAATFTSAVNITVGTTGFNASARTATVWLTAGVANTLATVEMAVTSNAGRVVQRTLTVDVRQL